jgi:hypothetical protein
MNLESIEQHSLNYLSQVSNPLVRIEVLHAHLRDRGVAGDMDSAQLKSFLESHALFRVMQSAPLAAGADSATSGLSANDPGEAYVILANRVPTQAQISAMMLEQLLALEQALITARAEALELGDPGRVGPFEEALRRVSGLREKLAPRPNPSK